MVWLPHPSKSVNTQRKLNFPCFTENEVQQIFNLNFSNILHNHHKLGCKDGMASTQRYRKSGMKVITKPHLSFKYN